MWDRRTYKEDPTTGERVPDESAQVPVYDYENPEPAEWPEADFIVGNPPFVGNKKMREVLGSGYTEAVRDAYLYKIPKSADFVMFWWYKAAKAVRGKLDEWEEPAERFEFVSTSSITQTLNRKVLEKQMKGSPPVSLVFAIPHHPWGKSKDGAAVRIAMTAGAVTEQPGSLQTVTKAEDTESIHWNVELAEETGNILSDLTIGPNVAGAEQLEANQDIAYRGVTLVGDGFVVEGKKAKELKRKDSHGIVKPFVAGHDLIQHQITDHAIDFYGYGAEEARKEFPEGYERIRERVKSEREAKRGETPDADEYADDWWLFAKTRPELRKAATDLDCYIVTPRTSKHRFFTFLDSGVLPGTSVVAVASDDPYLLGVLSSEIHVTWSLAPSNSGRMGQGNDPRYLHSL